MNRMQRNDNVGNARNCMDRLDLLRAIDFAIQETVLYLDAYPHSQEALTYYHQLIKQREEIMTHYEQSCGPITMYGNRSKTSWDWISEPWPWEPSAN
ncbi:MAG: spore coat protein CotJB [Clostridia bacterium]|nr:spore coat protein CotJB [Clostridia bacterium]